jgi:tRNA/tmRNA/rRNA uracil-C5-methylase (TrmA/RlmC/RlmD family)
VTGIGDRLDLDVGAIAHGGHCVARAGDGRVVFVRHSLPGERVRAVVTEERTGYLRADAVEIVRASPDRVPPPCRFSGPDNCGGCDFQHVAPGAQRDLKTAVVVEQLSRLGHLSDAEIGALDVRVQALPGGPLGWRSRIRYTVDGTGRSGLLKHRSHEVVELDRCVIATPEVVAATVTSEQWDSDDHVDVVSSGTGEVAVLAGREGVTPRLVSGPPKITEVLGEREWRLNPSAFWQVHPAAADTFVRAAMELLAPRPGEHAWDLYGGAGIFAAALAERVGPRGSVALVETDHRALDSASASLADLPQITYVKSKVERVRLRVKPDLVVLDPPRSGAGAAVVRMVSEARPRAIAYVACDPAALARDVATFRKDGWRLSALRAFDAFPMTHHVECIALLEPGR